MDHLVGRSSGGERVSDERRVPPSEARLNYNPQSLRETLSLQRSALLIDRRKGENNVELLSAVVGAIYYIAQKKAQIIA